MSVSDRPGRDPWAHLACAPGPPMGIAEWAESRLRRSPYLALKNVCCAYREGMLTLRGCLPTYYLKQVAQDTVAPPRGVWQVVNEIEVVPPAPAPRAMRGVDPRPPCRETAVRLR